MSLRVLWRNAKTAADARDLPVPPDVELRFAGPGEVAPSDRDWAEAIVTGSAPAGLLAGPALRHIVVPFAGVSPELREAALARPQVSVHNSHYNAVMVAHQALALMLACTHDVVAADTAMRRGDWGKDETTAPISIFLPGKVALLLGFGHIGKALVAPLRALGMEVRAWRRRPEPEEGVFTYGRSELLEALAAADAVLISLPATPETVGRVGAAELAVMKPVAVLVNVGRGAVVDEEALYRALAERRLKAAGIDVWYDYPPKGDGLVRTFPSKFPFQELDNVVMSPHRANDVAGWQRASALDTMETLACLARGEPRNLVEVLCSYPARYAAASGGPKTRADQRMPSMCRSKSSTPRHTVSRSSSSYRCAQ